EKRVFLVILFTSFSGSLVSRIPGAVQTDEIILSRHSLAIIAMNAIGYMIKIMNYYKGNIRESGRKSP
ncbi:hypothetical protein, partial [Escherichia coli]|uniref:hypothetical protein n=1 Tax=Escherichia coli TaxID=562 RepID=UPI0034D4434B